MQPDYLSKGRSYDGPSVSKGGNWQQYPIRGVDEAEGLVVVRNRPDATVTMTPRAINLFTKADHRTLAKPQHGRRPAGKALALRFALGLSAFDEIYQDEELLLKAPHRVFQLAWDLSSFTDAK